MPMSPRRLGAALVAVAVASGPAVVPQPAQALPVFSKAEGDAEGLFLNRSEVSCTPASTLSPPAFGIPVVVDGPATSVAASASGSMTRTGDPTDVVSSTTHFDATGAVSSLGGNPRTLEVTGSGSVSVSTTQSASQCRAEAVSHVALVTAFTVSQAGFLTITTTATAHTLILVGVEDAVSGDKLVRLVDEGSALSGPLTIPLVPGSYEGDFEIGARVRSSVPVPPRAVSASVRAVFTVAGSQLTADHGRGGSYVSLPDARECSAHVLLPTITDRKRQARRIKRVTFFVNGVPVTKARTPHRGVQLALPADDGARADVRAEVALRPKRKGRSGTVVATEATYEACS